MTTAFSSLPPTRWNNSRVAGLLWGTLTLAIAGSVGLSPTLAVEVLNPAAPDQTGVKPSSPLDPSLLAGVTEGNEPGVTGANEPGEGEISVQARDLLVEPGASANGSQDRFALPTVAPVAEAPAIAQTDGEPAAPSSADLVRQSQNPIANLISVPFQNNTNFGVGEFDRTGNILNIQPVIPTSLNNDWVLINRTIIPVAYQPELAPGVGSAFGLGDIFYQGFFSPKNSGSFTWGVGPAILLPTATDEVLGTGKWSIGPAAVGLVTRGPIVAGALVNNIWSIAGDGDRANVSLLTFQPFFNYNFEGGWYVTTSPIINANWLATGEKWTVPLGGGFGRVFAIGTQPVNMSLQGYWNVVRPEGAADWTLRAQLTLLFP